MAEGSLSFLVRTASPWANGPGVGVPRPAKTRFQHLLQSTMLERRLRTIGGVGPARGRGRGGSTRSHPEPGRETSQRRPVLWAHARGRGGRRGRTPPWRVASSCARVVGKAFPVRRGVEQRQLVGLITRRSGVRIPPPLPTDETLLDRSRRVFRVVTA